MLNGMSARAKFAAPRLSHDRAEQATVAGNPRRPRRNRSP